MTCVEIVRTDSGWHSRIRAANGRIVWVTEVYTRRRAAVNAVIVVGEALGVYLDALYLDSTKALRAGWPSGIGDTTLSDVDERGER